MMMETARTVAKLLNVQGIKIHLLHLLKGIPMIKQIKKGCYNFYPLKNMLISYVTSY